MKAKDFSIDWEFGGLWGCCEQHVQECDDDVKIGSTITCDHCYETMVLTKCEDGVIRWRKK